MRRLLLFLLVALPAAAAPLPDAPGVAECLVPAAADLYAGAARIRTLASTARTITELYLSREKRDQALAFRGTIRTRTGIDIFNPDSLRDAGIDVEKHPGVAYFGASGPRPAGLLLFIPVINPDRFPEKMLALLRAGIMRDGAGASPSVVSYRGRPVYRIGDRVQFAMSGSFCVVALDPAGLLLQRVLDCGEQGGAGASLAADPSFLRSRATRPAGELVAVYVRGGFTRNLLQSSGALFQSAEGTPPPDFSALVPALDYATIGLAVERNLAAVTVSLAFDPARVTPGLLDVPGTGMASLAVDFRDPEFYSFSEIDPVAAATGKPSPFDPLLRKVCGDLGDNFGAGCDPGIMASFGGATNVIIARSGAGSERIAFLPAKAGRGGALFGVFRDLLVKGKGARKGGSGKLAGREAFWFTDPAGARTYIVLDAAGLYAGRDPALLTAAMDAPRCAGRQGASLPARRMGPGVFFLLYMSGAGADNPADRPFADLFERTGSVCFTAVKKERSIVILFDIELRRGQ